MGSLLLGLLLLAAVAVAAASTDDSSSSRFKSIKRLGDNLLKVKLYHQSAVHEFDLVRDHALFAPQVSVLHSLGEHEWKTTRTYLAHPLVGSTANNNNWGVGFMEFKEDTFTGVFSISGDAFYVYPIKLSCGGWGQSMRPLSADELEAYTATAATATVASAVAASAPSSSRRTTRFFPGCYDNDSTPHRLSVSLATDQGYLQRVHKTRGRGAPLGELDKVKNVLVEIEHEVGVVRAMLLAQFNVHLQVERVVVGGKDSEFLRQSPSSSSSSSGGCRPTLQAGFDAFATWTAESAPDSGLWVLLTDCHGNNGLSSSSASRPLALVSHGSTGHAWLHFAQQMARTLGSSTSTGSGVQFTAGEPVCATLSELARSNSPHFLPLQADDANGRCGNGVLEPEEECECLATAAASKCQGCVACRLEDREQKCATGSAHAFVVRNAETPAYVAVSAALQSHPDCCTGGGRLAGSPTSCNAHRDVCSSTTGRCEKACSRFSLPQCGFDASGCVQFCKFEGRCQGSELLTAGTPPVPVGMVPNGNACQLPAPATQGGGRCHDGMCVANTSSIAVTAATAPIIITQQIEHELLTAKWTEEDVSGESVAAVARAAAERCPVFAHLLSLCPEQTTQDACGKLKCAWCGQLGQCRPTVHACALQTEAEIDAWYLPCQPRGV